MQMNGKTLRLLCIALISCWSIGFAPQAVREPNCSAKPELLKMRASQGKWGYVGGGNDFVIPPRYEIVQPFSEGLGLVKMPKDSASGAADWLYIDQCGRVVLAGFEDAVPFSDGRAFVKKNERWEVIARTGQPVFGGSFAEVRPTSGPYSWVRYKAADPRWIQLDMKTGKPRLTIDADDVIEASPATSWARKGQAWQLIANSMGTRISEAYQDVTPFSEGLAGARQLVAGGAAGAGKWGFVNEEGKPAIEFAFDFVGPFSEGVAPVKVQKHWGYIDKSGAYIIQPTYSLATPFANGLATVKSDTDRDRVRMFAIDRSGKRTAAVQVDEPIDVRLESTPEDADIWLVPYDRYRNDPGNVWSYPDLDKYRISAGRTNLRHYMVSRETYFVMYRNTKNQRASIEHTFMSGRDWVWLQLK